MTETYRPPKTVLAESADLPATLTITDVAALTGRGGETGAWAQRITAGIEERAAIVQETRMATKQERAEGADIPLAQALAELLDEVFEFYARTHEAHWNVAGQDFAEYHELFGDIYEDVHGSVDGLAENIRKIGSLAPSLCLPMEEGTRNTDPVALATALLEENEEVLSSIRAAFFIADTAGQQGIANYLAERQDAHAKWSWQLRSSLGIAEVGQPLQPVADDETSEVEEPMEMNATDLDVEQRRSIIEACEKRDFTAELRADLTADGNMRVRGYAATWDSEADGLPFREVIKRGAFARSLNNGDDVFLLVNHDTDQLPLARRAAGTLDLIEDEHGLLIDAQLDPKNPRAAELASALERGDVDKMSFAFTVAPEGSSRSEDGVRELRDLNLYEVSVVTWPAYSSTTVGLREADVDDIELRRRHLAAKQRHLLI